MPIVVLIPTTDTNIHQTGAESGKMIKSRHEWRKETRRNNAEPYKTCYSYFHDHNKQFGEHVGTKAENQKSKKRSYYQTEYITNPCDQLFGPKTLDCTVSSDKNEQDESFKQKDEEIEPNKNNVNSETQHARAAHSESYIPAPRWNKTQNGILEELYKKSRFPKTIELKHIASRLNVMDSDVDEWFRKRRGRDRKMKRKNDNLKSLIDNFLHQ